MQDNGIVQAFYSIAISNVPEDFIAVYEKNRESLIKASADEKENALIKRITGSSGNSRRSNNDSLAVRVLQLEGVIRRYGDSVRQRKTDEAQKDSQELLRVYSICTRDYYDGLRGKEQKGNGSLPREEVRFFVHRLFLDLVSMDCWNDPGLLLDISSMCYRLMRNWNRQNSEDSAFRIYYNTPAENDILNRYYDNIYILSRLFEVSFLEYMSWPSVFVSKEYIGAFLDAFYVLNKENIERERNKRRRYPDNVYDEDRISIERWKALLIGSAAVVLIILAAAVGSLFGSHGKVDTPPARERQQIEMDDGVTESEDMEQPETQQTGQEDVVTTNRETASDTSTDGSGKAQIGKEGGQAGQNGASSQKSVPGSGNGDYIKPNPADQDVETAEEEVSMEQ